MFFAWNSAFWIRHYTLTSSIRYMVVVVTSKYYSMSKGKSLFLLHHVACRMISIQEFWAWWRLPSSQECLLKHCCWPSSTKISAPLHEFGHHRPQFDNWISITHDPHLKSLDFLDKSLRSTLFSFKVHTQMSKICLSVTDSLIKGNGTIVSTQAYHAESIDCLL